MDSSEKQYARFPLALASTIYMKKGEMYPGARGQQGGGARKEDDDDEGGGKKGTAAIMEEVFIIIFVVIFALVALVMLGGAIYKGGAPFFNQLWSREHSQGLSSEYNGPPSVGP